MTESKWRQILDRVSETERALAKEILRKNLEKQGRRVSDEVLARMAEKAVEDARALIQKKGKQTLRGLKAGVKAFWDELKREAEE